MDRLVLERGSDNSFTETGEKNVGRCPNDRMWMFSSDYFLSLSEIGSNINRLE